MKIERYFEGHDIVEWWPFGGLPVWNVKDTCKCDTRIFAINEGFGINKSGRWPIHKTELRYSTLEDVIDEAPEWAEKFYVMEGKGFFIEFGMGGREHEIKGHLFNPEDYPEPVEVKR